MRENDIKSNAEELAKAHANLEESLESVFWFPDDKEIRLLELDRDMIDSDQIRPYYFPSDPENGIRYPSAVAVIRPEEKESLRPPAEWGAWTDALLIWKRNNSETDV